ncbi:MAG: S26 family signal peptidase [Candidatus Paceibacterota bacterium]
MIVNNKIVKNSEGKPYLISGNAYKMLSLYEKDYKGVIPENAYLLLGNLIFGSLDSTHFGLIDKSGIVAKVEI